MLFCVIKLHGRLITDLNIFANGYFIIIGHEGCHHAGCCCCLNTEPAIFKHVAKPGRHPHFLCTF